MSAVSAESPRGSADLSTSASSAQATSDSSHNGPAQNGPAQNGTAAQADFGPNQWLVDELYQRYQADPGSVDQAWWSFFADYHPQPDSAAASPADQTAGTVAPGQPVAAVAGSADRAGEHAGTSGWRRRWRRERAERTGCRHGCAGAAIDRESAGWRTSCGGHGRDSGRGCCPGQLRARQRPSRWCACAGRRRAQPRI